MTVKLRGKDLQVLNRCEVDNTKETGEIICFKHDNFCYEVRTQENKEVLFKIKHANKSNAKAYL